MSSVILVIADAGDYTACALAERWATHGAVLVTPNALSERGWRHRVGCPRTGMLATGADRTLEVASVQGVYTRLSHVREEDLSSIIVSDRAYVAAEMTAFLQAWLTELPCPVVNRPTSTCLAGPYWRRERWIRAAAELGIPVATLERNATAPLRAWMRRGVQAVTVVGDEWVGPVDHHVLGGQALRLARLAEAELLQVFFDTDSGADPRFVGADVWPDVTMPAVADALLRRVLAL